ncbi:hypothetical protein G7046_g7532 [Stylonectria norvegica]|nr:hypothetical protein G7046_g7532 [Stylonectria norvegica]
MASSDTKPAEEKKPEEKPEQKKPAALGEDDEFEDFPVDGTPPLFLTRSATQTSAPQSLRDDAVRPAARVNLQADHFPDWPEDQTEAAQQGSGEKKHLWEESWDDDDTNDDFSAQLKEELKKVEASKRR